MIPIKIIFTSDIHGYIYPTDYRNTDTKPEGLLAIKSAIEKTSNTLLIDGGDTIQGSPFMTYLQYDGTPLSVHPLTSLMNDMSYDYITLGNHDFNYGYTNLKTYTDTLNAKCLAANVIDHTGGIQLSDYDIKTFDNGIKLGIIGITTDFINVFERPENLVNFTISDTYEAFKKTYDVINEQVDATIVIYHGGFEYDLDTHKQLSESTENIGYKLCQDFDIDLLLTGHQHIALENRNLFGTHIVQTSSNGVNYLDIDMVFDKHHRLGPITSKLVVPGPLTEPLTYEPLDHIESKVQEWLDIPVGHLDAPLTPGSQLDMALNGSYLTNFFNQVQLELTGADISCTSLGNSVKGFNKKVSIRDVVSTYVYPNTLVVLEVTGDILMKSLEYCASYFDTTSGDVKVSDAFLKPKVAHYNYDYFAGIHYTFDLRKPVGSRVTKALFKDQPLNSSATYTLVMNNYRATGAGGYAFYKGLNVVRDIQLDVSEIIIDYFYQHKHVVVDKTTYLIVRSKKSY